MGFIQFDPDTLRAGSESDWIVSFSQRILNDDSLLSTTSRHKRCNETIITETRVGNIYSLEPTMCATVSTIIISILPLSIFAREKIRAHMRSSILVLDIFWYLLKRIDYFSDQKIRLSPWFNPQNTPVQSILTASIWLEQKVEFGTKRHWKISNWSLEIFDIEEWSITNVWGCWSPPPASYYYCY